MNFKRATTTFVLTAMVTAFAGSAFAADDPAWEKAHPRRAQVNKRLANENKRIATEVKEGDLTKKEGAELHKDVHQIRKEEKLMASQNNGHITKAEQKVLNQQENAVSKQIGK